MMLQVLASFYVGYTQVLFAPGCTPVVPTANLTIQAAVSTMCSHLICVPTFLEVRRVEEHNIGKGLTLPWPKMWAEDESAVTQLQKMKGIVGPFILVICALQLTYYCIDVRGWTAGKCNWKQTH